MKNTALFDLDGVLIDTEPQYSIIWGRIGQKYHPEIPDFAFRIKGMTLVNILNQYFQSDAVAQKDVDKMLEEFEAREMVYRFMPGVEDFLKGLVAQGYKTAVVTSSNREKMENVRQKLPQLFDYFNLIVTAEDFGNSKPAPDCYIKAAELLGSDIENCVVFEDSKNGIRAGMSAKMYTVGVATTFPKTELLPLATEVIETFVGYNISHIK